MFTVLYALPMTTKYFSRVRSGFSGCVHNQTLPSLVLGGSIIGVGMTLAGTVRAMVYCVCRVDSIIIELHAVSRDGNDSSWCRSTKCR